MAFDLNQHAGAGTENIDKGVLGMPLISIIQKGSPQFDETHKNHTQKRIPNCKPGDVFFAPTNRLIPKPLQVVVTGTTQLYTEWRPKSAGGGFVGSRALTVVGERGYRRGKVGEKDEHKEYLGDNELIYTIYVAVRFLESANKWENGFIALTSTQLKKGRAWQKQLATMLIPGTEQIAPIFASLWSITTVAEKNDEGGWFGFEIKFERMLDGEKDEQMLIDASEAFKEIKSKLPAPRVAGELSETAGGSAGAGDKEVPF